MQTPVPLIEQRIAQLPRRANDPPPPSDVTGSGRRRTYIRPRRGWQAVDLKELWRARDLVWQFTLRDIQVRYKQTFFGYAWALVVPVLQVLIFSVFFGNILGVGEKVNQAAGRALPYPLFALTGQIVWNLFKTAIDGASHSLIANGNIVRKVYIPRLALPLSALGKPAVDAAVVFVMMLGLAWWYSADARYDVRLTSSVALAPLLLIGSALPALAVGLIAAAITVHYRDLQYVLPFFTSLLFYVTPVIYSVDLLPERFAWLIYLNPIAGFVQAHRAVVMDLPVDWMGLGLSLGLSVVLLVFGLFFFSRAERRFADVA
ncbi:MAG TPA: ABC transporter permease [Tepidisphaeraceae bacterium]|nr:ABC transporter permease [Tepidisphaeraceae bacterium]